MLSRLLVSRLIRVLGAGLVALLLAPGLAAAQTDQGGGGSKAFKPEELEQIVAPIALYPDPLLAQILMASTYPLEIVQAARFVKANPKLKGDAARRGAQEADLGRQREVARGLPAGARHDEREARLDAEARRRVPRPAEGRDGRRPAPARARRRPRATSRARRSRR